MQLGVLHTVCDTNAKAMRQIKSLYPNIGSSGNYVDVLRNEDINGVVIATPSSLHYPMAMQALLADKDVFVEKPFALNVKDADEMASLSAERQRVLMVGHLMLYHPAIRLLKKYIQAGVLGDIHYLYSTRVNLGQIRCEENALWRLAPHDISTLIYLMDKAPSVVSARGFAYIQPNLADVAFVLLMFDKTAAHIQVSWLDPHKVRQLTVVGSKKMAVFDDTEPSHKLKIYDKGIGKTDLSIRTGETDAPQIDGTEALALECAEFIDCMKHRGQPLSGAKLGLDVVKTLEVASKMMCEEGK